MDQSEKRVHDAKMAAFDHLLEKVVNDPNYSAAAAAVAILIVLLTFGTSVHLTRVPHELTCYPTDSFAEIHRITCE